MLIKCPECGKEISNKAINCPNCGYPINEYNNNINCICNINGIDYNFKNVIESVKNNQYKKAIIEIKDLCGISGKNCLNIIDYIELTDEVMRTYEIINYSTEYDKMAYEKLFNKNNQKKQAQTQVHCPFCNSTNVNKISGTKKAMSIIGWGIFSNKVGKQWHCDNCKSDL